MTGAYRDLLRIRGVPRLASAVVAAGIAMQGSPVALVLLGREATGSFAGASALLVGATVGGLALAPARGRLVDRAGAARALPPLAAGSAAALVALVAAAHARAPLALLVALSAVAAASAPPVSAVMRTLWRELLDDDAARHSGFALLTVMQEIAFFAGPLCAGAIVAVASPEAGVLFLAALGLVATLVFATAPAARALVPSTATGDRPRLGVLALPGMRTVASTGGLAGATFGILDVALPAVARHHGDPAAAGPLLAAIALGIGVGSFAYGLVPPRRPPGRLYGPLFAIATIGLAPLVAATGAPLVAIGALLALSGLLFAPVTTCQYALIDHVAPPSMSTEAVSVLVTAYGACAALGAEAAGALADGPGLRAPFIAACACSGIAAMVATARRGTLLKTAPPDGTIEVDDGP